MTPSSPSPASSSTAIDHRADGRVRLACVGDIMCGDSFYAMGHGVASAIETAGLRFFPPQTVDYFHDHDVVLANIEAPLSDIDRRDRSLRSLHMRGRPGTASLLRGWGVDVATLANNHVLEHGRPVASDTAGQLRAAGIVPLGSGQDDSFDNTISVARIERQGLLLSFIGACTLDETYAHQGFEQWGDVLAAVADERRAGRTVIVTLHWGHELMDRPAAEQVVQARELAEAGAAVVAGHHPHVAQGVTTIDSCLVAFSLGNFVFNAIMPDTRWSFALSVDLTSDGVAGWSTVPVEAGSSYEPRLLLGPSEPGTRAAELRAELSRRNERAVRAIEGEDQAAYRAELAERTARSRRRLRNTLRSEARRYDPVMVPQILARPIVRRLGRW